MAKFELEQPVPRRQFLKLCLAGVGGLFLPAGLVRPLEAKAVQFDPDRLFVGEILRYDVTFWWFERVGEVSLSFQRLSGSRGYLAQAWGQTLGVIGFLTAYRRDCYRSFMTYDQQAGRLVPQRFEEESVVGQEIYRAVRVFDHQTQRIYFSHPKGDGQLEERIDQMPSPLTADYLTAIYNFRAGVYGPVEPGREIVIPTIPNQGSKEITISFLNRAETEKRRRTEKTPWPYYAFIKVDPKLLHNVKGHVHGWFSEELIPQQGVIRQVLFFGQVKGWLASRGRLPVETEASPLSPVEIRKPQVGPRS